MPFVTSQIPDSHKRVFEHTHSEKWSKPKGIKKAKVGLAAFPGEFCRLKTQIIDKQP